MKALGEKLAIYAGAAVLIALMAVVHNSVLITIVLVLAVPAIPVLFAWRARHRLLLRFWAGSGVEVLSRADVGGVLQLSVTLRTGSPEQLQEASVALVTTRRRRKEDLGVAFRSDLSREPSFDEGVRFTISGLDLVPLGPGRHLVELPIPATALPDLDHPDESVSTVCVVKAFVPGRIRLEKTTRVALTPPLAGEAPWTPRRRNA